MLFDLDAIYYIEWRSTRIYKLINLNVKFEFLLVPMYYIWWRSTRIYDIINFKEIQDGVLRGDYCYGFLLESRTAPKSCKVCLPMIRSYIGAVAPASYSTISGVRWTDLLAEYSTKEMLISPTFLVWKVPLEVPVPSWMLRVNLLASD
jgi:hypothetical protein